MNVLLLDDNLMSSMRVEGQLRHAEHQVRTASDLQGLPEGSDFDLVLINLGSRPLKGLEKLDEIKQSLPDAKIWGFCGHKEVEIWRAAKAAGVEKIVTNEVAMSELVLEK